MGKNGAREFDGRRWGIILAGGDGKRLLPLTRSMTGDDRPKQFCAVDGSLTLLRQTLDRIEGLIEPQRTLLVLTRIHERYYREQLSEIPSSRLLVQPQNKGTTPAILYSLMRIEEMDPRGLVAILPSDHHFEDVHALHRQLELGFAVGRSRPGRVILLGVVAGAPEESYGWIEPGRALRNAFSARISRVKRFWEKPSHAQAVALMRHGCLWNSFIMIGEVAAYQALMRSSIPDFYERFLPLRRFLFTPDEEQALSEVYGAIPHSSFSEDVLAANPRELAVMRGSGLGWTDMGEPARVMSVLARKQVQPQLNVAFAQAGHRHAEGQGDWCSEDGGENAVANVA